MTAFSLQSKWSPLSPGAGRDEHYLRYCPSPRVRLGPHSQGDPCPALQPARRGPRNRASGPGQRSVSVGQLWWGTARFRADKWDIRQHPNLHQIWAILLGTERLCVSLDSCRFTPPWKPGYAEPYGIHWDHDPRDTEKRMFQGVLALTDTGIDQGGFRCVPSLYSAHGPASQLLMLMAKIGSPTSPGARLRMCERRLATSSYGIRCSHTATRKTCRRDLALPFMS